MPNLKLNAEGQLVDEKGEIFLIGDEPVTVENAVDKGSVEAKIKERLKKSNERISALEEAAKETPALRTMLEQERTERTKLESQLSESEKHAEEKIQSQLAAAKKQATEYETALKNERAARVREQVSNQIMAGASDKFNNAAEDIVPKLLSVHKREPKRDQATGKEVEGEFVDLFEMQWTDPESKKDVREAVPLDKAIEVMASNEKYAHYLKSSGRAGSGGGNYGPANMNQKRSEMSTEQKVAFTTKHGSEAYKQLPE
jgi:hypothetical protein